MAWSMRTYTAYCPTIAALLLAKSMPALDIFPRRVAPRRGAKTFAIDRCQEHLTIYVVCAWERDTL